MKLHGIEQRTIHIDLVEAAPSLLPRLPKDASKAIKKRLHKKGIRIYLGQVVQGETANELTVNNKPIQSHTVIWTAGTANNPFFATNGFIMSTNHKVSTDIFLQAEENIFVLGDNANTPFSGMAQTAVTDGKFLAKNLIRRKNGKAMKGYIAKQPTTIIPVGEHWAAVIKGQIHIYGWLGWVLRQSADALAFHDYEPWTQAGRQWLTYYSSEETCKVCLESINGNTINTLKNK
jgi:NADH dehydrogenase